MMRSFIYLVLCLVNLGSNDLVLASADFLFKVLVFYLRELMLFRRIKKIYL